MASHVEFVVIDCAPFHLDSSDVIRESIGTAIKRMYQTKALAETGSESIKCQISRHSRRFVSFLSVSIGRKENLGNGIIMVRGRVGSTGGNSAGLQAEAPPHLVKRWQKSNWQ